MKFKWNPFSGVLDFANAAMRGATSLVAGSSGLIPAPPAGSQNKFLKGDGTWSAGGSGTGDLLAANNLSDVNSAIASVANLGLNPTVNARLLNRAALSDFFKSFLLWQSAPTTNYVGIGWYGDSVSPAVASPFIGYLQQFLPVSAGNFGGNYAAPSAGNSLGGINNNPTLTGTVLYSSWGRGVNQSVYNGAVSLAITRSGTTATAVSTGSHFLTTGNSVTISGATQTEYNGAFTVTVVNATTFTFTVSGTPATPATGTPIMTTVGAIGAVDFTYLPSADHVTLGNAATYFVDGNQSIPAPQQGCSEVRCYLATGPGMGSAFVELVNFDDGTTLNSATVSLSAGSIGATKAAFTGLSTTGHYQLRVTATGTVVVLRSFFLSGGGTIPVAFGIGGSTLAQNNYSNAAILPYLATDLNISLMFMQAKEEDPSVSIAPAMTRLNLLTTTSKLVVGSLPDVSGTYLVGNPYFRSNAIANSCAYFDGGEAVGNLYSELVRLGWQGDGTHADVKANAYAAYLIHAELALGLWIGTVERRNVRNSTTTATNFLVNAWTSGLAPLQFATNAGGGAPALIRLENLQEARFNSGANYAKVAGYGTFGIQIQDQANALAYLRFKNLESVDPASANEIWGYMRFRTAGNGLSFKEGASNSIQGVATLVAGTVTVNTTSAAANARIFVTSNADGGTPGGVRVASRVNATSFTITSTSNTDTSTVAWFILFPAP